MFHQLRPEGDRGGNVGGITTLKLQEDIDLSYLLSFLDLSWPWFTLTLSSHSSSCVLARTWGTKILSHNMTMYHKSIQLLILIFPGEGFHHFISRRVWELWLGSDLLSLWLFTICTFLWVVIFCHLGGPFLFLHLLLRHHILSTW